MDEGVQTNLNKRRYLDFSKNRMICGNRNSNHFFYVACCIRRLTHRDHFASVSQSVHLPGHLSVLTFQIVDLLKQTTHVFLFVVLGRLQEIHPNLIELIYCKQRGKVNMCVSVLAELNKEADWCDNIIQHCLNYCYETSKVPFNILQQNNIGYAYGRLVSDFTVFC